MTELRLDALVVVDAVERRDCLVVPAMILNQLSAARKKRPQVRIGRIHYHSRALVGRGNIIVESECAVVPLVVVENDVLEIALRELEHAEAIYRIPTKLAPASHPGIHDLVRT